MATKTLTNFKSRLSGGGARPNLFEANITFPNGISWEQGAQEDFQFLCKATSMPTQTIGSVEIPFRGRILKVAGDRTFEPWSVTVINDEDFSIRKSFEKWAETINNLTTGVGDVDPSSYMGTGEIRQLSRSTKRGATTTAGDVDNLKAGNSKVIHEYFIEEIWPSEIGSIDLSYESSDAVEEFTVTFQVQYFTSKGVSNPQDNSKTLQVGNDGTEN